MQEIDLYKTGGNIMQMLQQISMVVLNFFFLPFYLLFNNSKTQKSKGYSKRENFFNSVVFLTVLMLNILWIKLIHYSITTFGGVKVLSTTTIIITLIILPSAFLIISFFCGGKTETKDGDCDD
jgi:hypothetical protein